MSSDETEISDVMIIMLRCFAYHALGNKLVKLSGLLNRPLPQGEDHQVSLVKLDYKIQTLSHRDPNPRKLPNMESIRAVKNANGATSWDSRINLPLAQHHRRSINVFVQSKLRMTEQQKLSVSQTQSVIDREYSLLAPWKRANPGSQMMMITSYAEEIAAHPQGKYRDLICVDKDYLDAYFGKILGGRRRLMQLNERRALEIMGLAKYP